MYWWCCPNWLRANRVDLLTVVMHELGHELLRGDVDGTLLVGDLMSETLTQGVRRLATTAHPTFGFTAPTSSTVSMPTLQVARTTAAPVMVQPIIAMAPAMPATFGAVAALKPVEASMTDEALFLSGIDLR